MTDCMPVPMRLPRLFDHYFWAIMLTALVVVKLVWISVDFTPMLFLGDSESYLETANSGYIPPDRSFVYGKLLKVVAFKSGSLKVMLMLQVVCSLAAALILAYILVSLIEVPKVIAFATALTWASLEPLGIFYERYVMTESIALVAFSAYVCFALRYLVYRRISDVFSAQIMLAVLIMFRSVFVPVSIVLVIALPVVAWLAPGIKLDVFSRFRHALVAVAVAALTTGILHTGYKEWNGRLSKAPPAYQYADGFFLFAAWAPLIRVEDFDDPALGELLIGKSACKQVDRFAREAQRWYPGCMVDLLQKQMPDQIKSNSLARSVAMRAFRRDPLAGISLAASTWSDYFDRRVLMTALRYDRGERPLGSATVTLLKQKLSIADAAKLPLLTTVSNRWYLASSQWIMVLALLPFFMLGTALFVAQSLRAQIVFLFLVSGLMLGAVTLGATMVVPRYLHPFGWLIAIPIALVTTSLGSAALAWWKRRRREY